MTAICESFVLVDLESTGGLTAVPRRRRDAVLARLLHARLDSRLAGGEAPEAGRLLAVRAAQLTARRSRRQLADAWDAVAVRARTPIRPFDPRVPVARARVEAAADAIAAVADELRTERPVSAQGVAIAAALLTTAASPVYRGGAGADLASAVTRALRTL